MVYMNIPYHRQAKIARSVTYYSKNAVHDSITNKSKLGHKQRSVFGLLLGLDAPGWMLAISAVQIIQGTYAFKQAVQILVDKTVHG